MISFYTNIINRLFGTKSKILNQIKYLTDDKIYTSSVFHKVVANIYRNMISQNRYVRTKDNDIRYEFKFPHKERSDRDRFSSSARREINLQLGRTIKQNFIGINAENTQILSSHITIAISRLDNYRSLMNHMTDLKKDDNGKIQNTKILFIKMSDKSTTIDNDLEFVNHGVLFIEKGAELNVSGKLINKGVIINEGVIMIGSADHIGFLVNENMFYNSGVIHTCTAQSVTGIQHSQINMILNENILYNLKNGKIENDGTIKNNIYGYIKNSGDIVNRMQFANGGLYYNCRDSRFNDDSNDKFGEIHNYGQLINKGSMTCRNSYNYRYISNISSRVSRRIVKSIMQFANIDNYGEFVNGEHSAVETAHVNNHGTFTNKGQFDSGVVWCNGTLTNERSGSVNNTDTLNIGRIINNGLYIIKPSGSLKSFGTVNNSKHGKLYVNNIENHMFIYNYGILKRSTTDDEDTEHKRIDNLGIVYSNTLLQHEIAKETRD